MANTPQSGLPVSFAYQYNDANQRIRTVLKRVITVSVPTDDTN
jgi:hypothetical protein